jgi:hypothetical protein
MERSALMRQHCPLLAAALPWVGRVVNRNRRSAAWRTPTRWPISRPVAVALDAEFRIASPALADPRSRGAHAAPNPNPCLNMELAKNTQTLKASRTQAWDALNNPEILARALPDCESMERLPDEGLRVAPLQPAAVYVTISAASARWLWVAPIATFTIGRVV